jgi:hypothetical protein
MSAGIASSIRPVMTVCILQIGASAEAIARAPAGIDGTAASRSQK